MTPETLSLIRDALALDPDQRAVLANVLLDSLRPGPGADDISDAWLAEAAHRLDAVRGGDVRPVIADEHYAHLRASLAR